MQINRPDVYLLSERTVGMSQGPHGNRDFWILMGLSWLLTAEEEEEEGEERRCRRIEEGGEEDSDEVDE